MILVLFFLSLGLSNSISEGVISKQSISNPPGANGLLVGNLKVRIFDIDLEEIDCNNKVDSLIVAVGHKEYRELRAKTIRDYCKGDAPIIADVKSLYKKEDLINEGFNVLRL